LIIFIAKSALSMVIVETKISK